MKYSMRVNVVIGKIVNVFSTSGLWPRRINQWSIKLDVSTPGSVFDFKTYVLKDLSKGCVLMQEFILWNINQGVFRQKKLFKDHCNINETNWIRPNVQKQSTCLKDMKFATSVCFAVSFGSFGKKVGLGVILDLK